MRIDYLVYGDAFVADGVTEKIAAQCARWRAEGHDARVVFVTYPPRQDAEPVLDAECFPFAGMSQRVRATLSAVRAIRRRRPDLVYMRYDWFSPPPVPLLAPIPVVVEINGDERAEGHLYGPAIGLYNSAHWLATIPFAAGFVTVTRELLSGLGGHATGVPATAIANGIELGGIPEEAAANEGGDRLVMLIGARPTPVWNGLDRIGALARAMPDVRFDLIGVGRAPVVADQPANLVGHEAMPRADYGPMLRHATAAIGPLALHRKDLDEACPLKVRDYLAHGLPLLTSHRDTDFLDEEPWFIHRVPNDESDITDRAGAIGRWLASVRGRRVPREAIRHLDVTVKERARLAFFAHVLARRGRPPR